MGEPATRRGCIRHHRMQGDTMKIREPRATWTWFLWLWAAIFGGIPLAMLVAGPTGPDGPPLLVLLLFPAIAVAVLVPVVRRTLRVGFTLEEDGIHGAHDAESSVIPWDEVERIAWQWSEATSNVKVNGRPLPDGYALHAVLRDGRAVRLMQRVAAKYGQQQDLNEQMARAQAAGVLPVSFDGTIPTHGEGEWSGTPPSRSHTAWDGGELPRPGDSPLDDAGASDEPTWPTG